MTDDYTGISNKILKNGVYGRFGREFRMIRQEVVERYGPIDFAARHWPNQNKFMVMLAIPPHWFSRWRVYDPNTGIFVRNIYCNVDIEQPLFKALSMVHVKGLGDKLCTFDGCFEIRKARGSDSFSAHSYGLALDINAFVNPLGSTHGGFYDMSEVVSCFKDQGFSWGGDWRGRKDPMHFTWTGF